jgi:hypothetical protein
MFVSPAVKCRGSLNSALSAWIVCHLPCFGKLTNRSYSCAHLFTWFQQLRCVHACVCFCWSSLYLGHLIPTICNNGRFRYGRWHLHYPKHFFSQIEPLDYKTDDAIEALLEMDNLWSNTDDFGMSTSVTKYAVCSFKCTCLDFNTLVIITGPLF